MNLFSQTSNCSGLGSSASFFVDCFFPCFDIFSKKPSKYILIGPAFADTILPCSAVLKLLAAEMAEDSACVTGRKPCLGCGSCRGTLLNSWCDSARPPLPAAVERGSCPHHVKLLLPPFRSPSLSYPFYFPRTI